MKSEIKTEVINLKTDTLKESLQLIPVLTITLIIIGFLDSHFYYNEFDIKIYNYLDASELIFLFSNSLISLITIGVVIAFLYFIVILIVSAINVIRWKQGKKPIRKIITTLVVGFLFYKLTKQFVPWEVDERYFDILILKINPFIIGLLLLPIRLRLNFIRHTVRFLGIPAHTFVKWLVIILCTSFILVHFSFRNGVKHQNLLTQGSKYSIDLRLNDEREIHTNTSLVFLGQTNSYLFFRNLKSKTNIIVPLSTIKEIKMKMLRKTA